MTRRLDSPRRRWYHRRVRVLRYGATATWIFRGVDVPPVETAYLTIKDRWALETEEQPPDVDTLRLRVVVVPALSDEGFVSTDEDGNWVATFNLSALETEDDLGPGSPPVRILFYEVTLFVEGGATLRPFVGQIRMLPDVFSGVASS